MISAGINYTARELRCIVKLFSDGLVTELGPGNTRKCTHDFGGEIYLKLLCIP